MSIFFNANNCQYSIDDSCIHVSLHYNTCISTSRNIHHTRHLLFLLLRDSSLNSHDHQLKKHYMSDLQCNPLSFFWIKNEVDIVVFCHKKNYQSFQFLLLSPLHDCANQLYTEIKSRTVAYTEAHS